MCMFLMMPEFPEQMGYMVDSSNYVGNWDIHLDEIYMVFGNSGRLHRHLLRKQSDQIGFDKLGFDWFAIP